jgi:GPH family glycoside/pentoside/hexuronide:cation symporter
MGDPSSLIDKSSQRWAIRAGSFLVPVAHAAGQNVVTVMGLRYLTDNQGMAAGAAGLIFAGVKIYDGFLDPAVGAWSDNARTRWGRRIPFLLAGGFAMPLGLALLFGVPDLGSILLTQIVVTLALALHASGFTLLTIPGFAMVIESSADPHERTRLMAWRTYGNAVGTLLGSTLPAWMLARIGADRVGHMAMALTVGAVVLLATLLAVRLLASAPRTVAATDAPRGIDLARQARLAWANRPFRILALAHVLLLFGTAIGSASLAYFSRHVLKVGDGLLGTYFMASTVALVASMPLWVRLSRTVGKKPCYITAMALFATSHLSWMLAASGEGQVAIIARALVSGLAGGGMILCAYAMLSDAVRWDYVQSGQRREGAFAGFTTLFDKLSSAAALAAMGAFLSAMGYVSSAAAGAVQGESAIFAIRLCVAAVPAAAMGAAILAVLRYDLDPVKLAAAEAAMMPQAETVR